MSRIARSDETDPRYSVAERLRYWLVEERRLLLEAVGGLTEAESRIPLEPAGWSVRDILAHRVFWEGREAEAIGQYLLGKRVELLDFPVKRIDGTNATAVETLRGHSTKRLLRALGQSREALLALVAKIDDDALNRDDDAAQLVLGVALEHDREHRKQIQAWRRARAQAVLNPPPDPAPDRDAADSPTQEQR